MARAVCVFALSAFSALAPSVAAASDIEAQRRDYAAARQALANDDRERFQQLHQRLEGYVLRDYLRYAWLKERLGETAVAEIQAFLASSTYAAFNPGLRARWLTALAEDGQWDLFMEEYRPGLGDASVDCLRLQRLLQTEAAASTLAAEIERLWLTDERLPSECDPVFSRWHEAGQLTEALVWRRIEQLMGAYRPHFAGELGQRYLAAAERVWLRRWLEMHRDPARALRTLDYPLDHERARRIVKHGIARLGTRDPQVAMTEWERVLGRHPVLASEHNEVLRRLGILAAQRHLPVAVAWLFALPDDPQDTGLQLWRLRAALRAGAWQHARRLVDGLDVSARDERLWWYWTARVMERTGDDAKARQLFALLARNRHYYGFLAADRLGAAYAMQHEALGERAEEVRALDAQPGLQAAREFHAIGELEEARRQWNFSIARLSPRELEAAAVLAHNWGLTDRAIYTLSRLDNANDVDLRFPLLYRDIVDASARDYAIDPSWIYGVMRQESAFVVDARSPAGALGLMQLMPHVGRATAKRLRFKLAGEAGLLEVQTNLRLGAAFLKNMLRRYDGHQALATAAYNAGPSRVKAWLPAEGMMEGDIWIETIPFEETRAYVKNVLAFSVVYDYRLQREPARICTRMPPIVTGGAPAGRGLEMACRAPAAVRPQPAG